MMNGRNGRDSLYGSINHNRRSNTFNHHSHNHHDDNTLDLFSNNRRSLSLPSSDDSSDGIYFITPFHFSFLISPKTCFLYVFVCQMNKKSSFILIIWLL